jgi:hypothetical protein
MLLSITQNKQGMADFSAISACGLANGGQLCDANSTDPAHRHHIGDSAHFRTSSPRGRLASYDAMLPAFSPIESMVRHGFAAYVRCRGCVLYLWGYWYPLLLKKEAGGNQCHTQNQVNLCLNHAPSWRSVGPLRPAVIRSPIKRCLAVPQALAWPLSRAVVFLLARPSGQTPKWFIVEQTQENATKTTDRSARSNDLVTKGPRLTFSRPMPRKNGVSRFRSGLIVGHDWRAICSGCTVTPMPRTEVGVQRPSIFTLPDVKQRQFVLRLSQWANTAQSRGSYYETSNLHFCSSRHNSGRCMCEARRGIKPWKNFAFGSTTFGFTNRQLTDQVARSRVTAHHSNYIASTVPHQRGGFLRFPIQTQPSQIQKDIPCSTRS